MTDIPVIDNSDELKTALSEIELGLNEISYMTFDQVKNYMGSCQDLNDVNARLERLGKVVLAIVKYLKNQR